MRLQICLVLVASCASPKTAAIGPTGDDGKADGPGAVPGDGEGSWSREVVDDSATLWNGGPVGWGAGTSVAVKADGTPVVAYYNASYQCNNGGFGTYSPDALDVARFGAQGWTHTIEACGPYAGYWPKLLIDGTARMHVLFGSGWFTAGQRGNYLRWAADGTRDTSKVVDSGYFYDGSLAYVLDDTGAPVIVSNGQLVAADGTKTAIFPADTERTFIGREADGTLHVVGNTMVPDPADPNTSTARMRYARKDASGVTIDIPRASQPNAQALGLVLDSTGQVHILSWNAVPMAAGELWHTTLTSSGWVDERIANDVTSPSAALAIDGNDELLVVTSGRLYRRGSVAAGWTTTNVSQLSSASYPSLAIAPDGTLHVAFQIVGEIMSNSVSRAPLYHAAYHR